MVEESPYCFLGYLAQQFRSGREKEPEQSYGEVHGRTNTDSKSDSNPAELERMSAHADERATRAH